MLDKNIIRIVEDFPKKGIRFIDITTLLNNTEAFREVFEILLEKARLTKPDVIVAMEARGYFFGPALALALNLPFVPIRKKGKLPYKTYSEKYDLEYGTAEIEMHQDAFAENLNVLIFDDILATGGTASATVNLVKNLHPKSIHFLFLMEIPELNGRNKIENYDIQIAIK